MPGRTENTLKNFFYSNLRRSLKVLEGELRVLDPEKEFNFHFFSNLHLCPDF
jgi:hypothetical protein